MFYNSAEAQSPSQRNPDVSNKALITKSTPSIKAEAFKNQSASAATATLHKLADDYYAWRNENYPVRSSEAGLHTWDDRLTDYSPAKIAVELRRPRYMTAAVEIENMAIRARLPGGNADRPDAVEVEALDQRARRRPRGEPPEPPIMSSQGLDRRSRP